MSRVNGFSALEDRLKAMENLLKQSQRAPELGDDQILVQASDSSQAGSNESPTFTIDTASPESRRPFEFAPQDQAIQLAQGYLACCNTMMPTFNTGKMLRRMQREWPPDKDADLTWWTTMAIALSFAHRLRAMSDNSGAEYDNREASKYLSEVLDVAPRLAFAKPSVDTAEVLLALTAVMRGSATPETARMFTACAIHVLQELDAHNINSEVYASLTNSQASDLARAWWVAYIHDKNIAILGGKPPIAHEQDVNRPPPQWADVEGFGFVRSLDGSAEANFQVISHRLAVISSQVYTRTMSPNAEVTPAGMTAAQTALNPLLEGWKARLPFVFKPEALVGRWPKHCVIFLAMLHFQYFQTLLQLNRELSTDPLKVLVVNGGLDLVNQLKAHPFSLSPAVVEAARDGLRLASLTPKGTLQHVWSVSYRRSIECMLIVRPGSFSITAYVPLCRCWSMPLCGRWTRDYQKISSRSTNGFKSSTPSQVRASVLICFRNGSSYWT